eukprot:tig00000889_g5298.t1
MRLASARGVLLRDRARARPRSCTTAGSVTSDAAAALLRVRISTAEKRISELEAELKKAEASSAVLREDVAARDKEIRDLEQRLVSWEIEGEFIKDAIKARGWDLADARPAAELQHAREARLAKHEEAREERRAEERRRRGGRELTEEERARRAEIEALKTKLEELEAAEAAGERKAVQADWSTAPGREALAALASHIALSARDKREEMRRVYKAGMTVVIRVFISSTFKDFHGERNALVKTAFPQLNEQLAAHRVFFIPLDLRWGLTAEDTSSHGRGATLLCLDEVERCRGYFLYLGGERYGWAPAAYETHGDGRYAWLERWPPRNSLTSLEVYYGFLAAQEPAIHALAALRGRRFHKGLAGAELALFGSESEEVGRAQAALLRAVRAHPHVKLLEYECAFEAGSNPPATTGLEEVTEWAVRGLRAAVEEDLGIDAAAAEESAAGPAHAAAGAEGEGQAHAHVQQEGAAQDYFAFGRCRAFHGRQQELAQLAAFADGRLPGGNLLALVAAPGAGKSALLAKFLMERGALSAPGAGAGAGAGAGPGGEAVVYHFIGATAYPAGLAPVLQRLLHALGEALPELRAHAADAAALTEARPLAAAFKSALAAAAAAGRRLLLVLDALNQLAPDAGAHGLAWLPPEPLPANVRIVVSTLDGPALEALRGRAPPPRELPLGELSLADRRAIVSSLLALYGKRLADAQLEAVVGKREAVNALYLSTAADEIRVYGLFERVTELIEGFAPDLEGLLAQLLARMEAEHGAELPRDALSLVCCSRSGLLEEELLALLRRPEDRAGALPRAAWARLYYSLQSLMRPVGDGAGLLDFFHRQVRKAVRVRYLTACPERCATFDRGDPCEHVGPALGWDAWNAKDGVYHRRLAAFFLRAYEEDDRHGPGAGRGKRRAAWELPRHLLLAHMHERLGALLTDVAFLYTKAAAGGLHDLLDDFAAAAGELQREAEGARAASDARLRAEAVTEFHRAPAPAHAPGPARRPAQSGASGAGRRGAAAPAGSPVEAAAQSLLARAPGLFRDTLQWVNKASGVEPLVGTLAGHEASVTCCAAAPDGLSFASGDDAGSLRLWEAHTGSETAASVAHELGVACLAFAPDGRRLATAGHDAAVRLWDARSLAPSGACAGAPRCPLYSLAFSPDGTQLAACGYDGSARVWAAADVAAAPLVIPAPSQGGASPAMSLAFHPALPRLAVAHLDGTVAVHEARTGALVRALRAPQGEATALAFRRPDGRLFAVAGARSVAALSEEDGSVRWEWGGHAGPVRSVAFSPDGSLLASAGAGHAIRVWSGQGPEAKGAFEAPGGSWVACVAFAPDGRRILAALDDRAVWDARAAGAAQGAASPAVGHQEEVYDVAFAPAGDRIASCCAGGYIRLWDGAGRSVLGKAAPRDAEKACERTVSTVSFSPDGRTLASGDFSWTLKTWDATSRPDATPLASNDEDTRFGWINQVAWTPDSSHVLVAGFSSRVSVLAAHPGGLFMPLVDGMTHAERNYAVNVFVEAGGALRVVTGGMDGSLRLWRAPAPAGPYALALAVPDAHEQRVYSAVFSPDGALVLTASEDGSCKLFDAATGRLAAVVARRGEACPLYRALFSPAGDRVLVAGEAGGLLVYDLAAALRRGPRRPPSRASSPRRACGRSRPPCRRTSTF